MTKTDATLTNNFTDEQKLELVDALIKEVKYNEDFISKARKSVIDHEQAAKAIYEAIDEAHEHNQVINTRIQNILTVKIVNE